jgi:predicted alpha/beta hydrolase
VACRWKPEYLNRTGRPLLDNGSVTRFPVSLSGWQTRQQSEHILQWNRWSHFLGNGMNNSIRRWATGLVAAVLQACPIQRTYETTDEPLGEGVFYTVRLSVIRDPADKSRSIRGHPSRVEAGSNISTVSLPVVGGDEKGSLESGTVKYGHESHGTRIREWKRWREPAAIVNDRPILSSERMLYKDYDCRCSFEKRTSGRESQGARRQDELIGGKPPVVK